MFTDRICLIAYNKARNKALIKHIESGKAIVDFDIRDYNTTPIVLAGYLLFTKNKLEN